MEFFQFKQPFRQILTTPHQLNPRLSNLSFYVFIKLFPAKRLTNSIQYLSLLVMLPLET